MKSYFFFLLALAVPAFSTIGDDAYVGTCGQWILGSFPHVRIDKACLLPTPRPGCSIEWKEYRGQTVVLDIIGPESLLKESFAVQVRGESEFTTGDVAIIDPKHQIDSKVRSLLAVALKDGIPKGFWAVATKKEKEDALKGGFDLALGDSMDLKGDLGSLPSNQLNTLRADAKTRGYPHLRAGLLIVVYPDRNWPPMKEIVHYITAASLQLGVTPGFLQLFSIAPETNNSSFEFNVLNLVPYQDYRKP